MPTSNEQPSSMPSTSLSFDMEIVHTSIRLAHGIETDIQKVQDLLAQFLNKKIIETYGSWLGWAQVFFMNRKELLPDGSVDDSSFNKVSEEFLQQIIGMSPGQQITDLNIMLPELYPEATLAVIQPISVEDLSNGEVRSQFRIVKILQ